MALQVNYKQKKRGFKSLRQGAQKQLFEKLVK